MNLVEKPKGDKMTEKKKRGGQTKAPADHMRKRLAAMMTDSMYKEFRRQGTAGGYPLSLFLRNIANDYISRKKSEDGNKCHVSQEKNRKGSKFRLSDVKTKTVVASVTENTYREFHRLCEEAGISVTSLLCNVVESYLERGNNK